MAPHRVIEQAQPAVGPAVAGGLAMIGNLAAWAESSLAGLTMTGVSAAVLVLGGLAWSLNERRLAAKIRQAETEAKVDEILGPGLRRKMEENAAKLDRILVELEEARAALKHEQERRHAERDAHNGEQLALKVQVAGLMGRIEGLNRDTRRAAHDGGFAGAESGAEKAGEKVAETAARRLAAAMDPDPAPVARPTPPGESP